MPKGRPNDPTYTNARCACGRRYFRHGSMYCCAECRTTAAPHIPQHVKYLDGITHEAETPTAPIALGVEIAELASAPPPAAADDVRADLELAFAIRLLLETLTPRERIALSGRFGIDSGEEMTLDEAGALLGVTYERARQIIEKALRKLRHPSRSKWLATFVDPNHDHAIGGQP